MTTKRHGKWEAPTVALETAMEKPDYRSRMSDKAKGKPPPIVYSADVEKDEQEPERLGDDSHLFLFKNIFN